MYRDFRANFTVTLCCEVNSGRKWEFQYQRGIANGTYFHSCTGRAPTVADGAQWVARARACGRRRAEQRRARVEQCVGVEQRWQGLRSVNPLSARRGGATADPAKGRPARSPTLTVGGAAHAKAREEAQVSGRIGDTGTRPVRTVCVAVCSWRSAHASSSSRLRGLARKRSPNQGAKPGSQHASNVPVCTTQIRPLHAKKNFGQCRQW